MKSQFRIKCPIPFAVPSGVHLQFPFPCNAASPSREVDVVFSTSCKHVVGNLTYVHGHKVVGWWLLHRW